MYNRYPDLDTVIDCTHRPVDNPNPQYFTREQIAEYNERGFITPFPLFQGKELQVIHDYFIGGFGADQGRRENNGDIATPRSGLSMHTQDAGIYDVVTHPRTLGYLRDLLGPDIVCHISRFKNKPPGMSEGGDHHQDATFNAMDARCAIVWLALEDADVENGCMWFVPGSHKLGVVECDAKHQVINPRSYGKEEPVPVRAGHAIFMNDLVFHSSPANRSASRYRPALTATYAPASVRPYKEQHRSAILCCGRDVSGRWQARPRPEGQRLFPS